MWQTGAFLRGVVVPAEWPWQVTLIPGHETKEANATIGCVSSASACLLLIQAEGTSRDLLNFSVPSLPFL